MICALLLGLAVAPHAALAEAVSVQAELVESEIFLGESVELKVRIEGVRQAVPPDVRHPDMAVSFEGGQTFSDVTYTIVNGQTRQVETFGYTARYILRPQRAGVLSIPAVAVKHNGRIYHSNPLQLTVRRPTGQDLLLVEVSTDKPSYVLGETVTVTLDLSLRKLAVNGTVQDLDPFFPNRPPELQIPWFEGIKDWRTDDLDAFVRPLLGRRRAGFTSTTTPRRRCYGPIGCASPCRARTRGARLRAAPGTISRISCKNTFVRCGRGWKASRRYL